MDIIPPKTYIFSENDHNIVTQINNTYSGPPYHISIFFFLNGSKIAKIQDMSEDRKLKEVESSKTSTK